MKLYKELSMSLAYPSYNMNLKLMESVKDGQQSLSLHCKTKFTRNALPHFSRLWGKRTRKNK